MHFHVVALKETAVISVSKRLSINVLYLAGINSEDVGALGMDSFSRRPCTLIRTASSTQIVPTGPGKRRVRTAPFRAKVVDQGD